jgi:threonine-phosphate decarboxylase
MSTNQEYDVVEKYNKDTINLSVNTNLLGMPKSVKIALAKGLELCSLYPDAKCSSLTKAIAKYYSGISASQVLCVSGVDDVIYRIIYAQRPKKAVILAPTYEDYEKALCNAGCTVKYHLLQKKDKFQITETIFSALTVDVDLFFLCNPNNPTGKVINTEFLRKILVKCKDNGITLVVDESFIGFLDNPEQYTARGLIGEYSNLVILDGFTKLYAIPGLRLGFCISSNQELLRRIFETGQAWSVSVLAQLAGIAALEDKEYLEEMHDILRIEKSWLRTEMSNLKIEVWGSSANYLFFPAPFHHVRELLEKDGIILRNCENFSGLDGEFCRVAIKTHQENEKFIEAIRKHIV